MPERPDALAEGCEACDPSGLPMPGVLGTFCGGTMYLHGPEKARGFSFDVVDLDTDELRRLPLDFLAHGFTTKPGARHVAVVFEKRGPGAAVLDLATFRLVGKIRARAARDYYGHGAFSRDGDQLFSIETDRETGDGVISVRETTRYIEVETFPTYGARPHDCMLVDDGKVLVMTNGGGDVASRAEPCVTYVDVASRKLLEKVTFTDPKVNAGHLAIREDGAIAIVSAPRDGLIPETSSGGIHVRATRGRKPERLRGPDAVMQKILGESLSVCVHGDLVAVTNPLGGIVTLWSLAKKKLLASHACESPRGVEVTADRRSLVVTYGVNPTVVLLDIETFLPSERSFAYGRFSGSHIFPFPELAA